MIKSLFLRHNEIDSNINLKDMLQDIMIAQQQLLQLQQGIQITNREIGELVITTLPIVNPNYLELDGALYTRAQYPKLYKHLVLLKNKYPDYFCTQEEFDTSMSDKHICPKYVLDEENETIRLPRVSGMLEISGLSAHGFFSNNTVTEETIPNLKGDFGSGAQNSTSVRWGYAGTHTGVFSKTGNRVTKNYTSIATGESNDDTWGATFDASAYDSRYKDGAKLHPQTTVFKAYIVVGRDSAYPHIVYSWFGENSEVRVYSDGYCTQSGSIENSDLLEHQVTFNFPFASNVNVQITPYRLGAETYEGNYLLTELTNTSFTVKHPQYLGFKYIATGKVDLSIIPVEVDYSCQSTDILEMMEYTKAMKEKMANTEIVLELPPEEERDPNKMYIVVSPDNVHVTQNVIQNFYGSSEEEIITGSLSSSFTHSGAYEVQENTEHEVLTPNISAENPTQTFTFTEFKSLPEVTELPENVSIKEITKNSVTIGYDGFTPDVHEDNTAIEKETTLTEKGESISGDITQTFYHSGAFTSNTENKEFTFDLDEQTAVDGVYTLEFEELDAVPEVEFVGEIEILAKSTSYVNVIGQGVLTITGRKTTRTFETEEKSLNVQDNIPLSKEYIEPRVILTENSEFSVAIDGPNAIVTYPVSGTVTYGEPLIIEKSFTFEVQEGHIKQSDPEPSDPENPDTPSDPQDPSSDNPSDTSTIELSADAIVIDGKETSETFTVTSNCELDVEVTNKGKINLKENNGTYTVSGNYDGTSEIKFTAKDGKEGTAEETSKTVTVTISNCTNAETISTQQKSQTVQLSVRVEHPRENENVLTQSSHTYEYKNWDKTKTLESQTTELVEPISIVTASNLRQHGKATGAYSAYLYSIASFDPNSFTFNACENGTSNIIDFDWTLEYLTPSITEPYYYTEEEVATPHTIHLNEKYDDISDVVLKATTALQQLDGNFAEPSEMKLTYTRKTSSANTKRNEVYPTYWTKKLYRGSGASITCHKFDFNPNTNDLTIWVSPPTGGYVMAGAPIIYSQTVSVQVKGTLSENTEIPPRIITIDCPEMVDIDGIDDIKLIHITSNYELKYKSKYVVLEHVYDRKVGDTYDYYYRLHAFKNTEGVEDNYIRFYCDYGGDTLMTVNVQNAPSNVDTLEWTITQDSGSFTVSNGKVQYPCLPIMRNTAVDNAGINPDDYEIYINGELSERKINKMDVLKMNKGDIVTVKRISDQAGWFAPYTFAGAGSANTNKNSYVKILTKELPLFTKDGNKPVTSADNMFRYNYNIDDVDVDRLFKNFKNNTTFVGVFSESYITRLMDISKFTKTTNLSMMYSTCTKLTISDNDAHYFDMIEVPVNISGIFAYCTNINRIPEGMLDNPNITDIRDIMRRSIGGQQNDLDISTIPERYGMTLADISGLS